MEKILLLTENGFEDKELMYPYYRFQEAGYQVVVVGSRAKETHNGNTG
jgi:protease I